MDSLSNMDFEKAKTAADNALQEKISDLQQLAGRDPSRNERQKHTDFMDYEVLSEKIDGDTASLRLKISAFSEETVEAIKLKWLWQAFLFLMIQILTDLRSPGRSA